MQTKEYEAYRVLEGAIRARRTAKAIADSARWPDEADAENAYQEGLGDGWVSSLRSLLTEALGKGWDK